MIQEVATMKYRECEEDDKLVSTIGVDLKISFTGHHFNMCDYINGGKIQ
jgi:hypothetical protein